jgi:hypothetical protein
MHVDGVEATTASMIAELRPASASRLWVLTGNPCEHDYASLSFDEAAEFFG